MLGIGKEIYMVTETNVGLGQVPEIWAKTYHESETAIDDILNYLDETEQFYGRENDINNIKSELKEDGFTYFGDEEICFTVQKISL